MPVLCETQDEDTDDYRVVKFDKTPKMSTYLVAIVVGEYEFVEGKSEEGNKYYVWCNYYLYTNVH